MTKKDEQESEKRLLGQASLDDLIKMKMEEEINAEFEKLQHKPEKKLITEIAKVPSDLIFSKNAIYRLFHRVQKTQTFINGVQAEALLGLQTSLRNKIKSGQVDAFSTENAYVKFEKIEY